MSKSIEILLNKAEKLLESKGINVIEARMESKALFFIDDTNEVKAILDTRSGIMIKPDALPYDLKETDIIAIIPVPA